MTTKLILVILGCWAIVQVWADPPVLLRVIRNVQDVDPSRTYADARTAVNVLGMRAVSGLDDAWLVEMHDSFASIEEVDQALASTRPVSNSNGSGYPASAALLAAARALTALDRPGLTTLPHQASKAL